MNKTWDAPTRRIVAVGLVVMLIFLIYLARPVLPYLIVATLMAYVLAPLISFLNKKLRIPKVLAILFAYVLLVVSLLLLIAVLVPAVLDSFEGVTFDPVSVISDVHVWLIGTLEDYRVVQLFTVEADLSTIIDPVLDFLTGTNTEQFSISPEQIADVVTTAFGTGVDIAAIVFGTLASAIFSIALTFLYAIYMSTGTGGMREEIKNWIPPNDKEELAVLGRKVEGVWSAFLMGQLKLCFIIFLITWAVGLAIGLPGAFALAVIAGLLEFIPNLGPFLAAIPAALVALLQGSSHLNVSNFTFMLIVILAYVLIQQLENNLIVPKVLGGAVELPALVVLTGVVVGLSVGGILGAFIAIPLIASGREIVRYAYLKVIQEDPFPDKPVVEEHPPPEMAQSGGDEDKKAAEPATSAGAETIVEPAASAVAETVVEPAVSATSETVIEEEIPPAPAAEL